MDKKSLIKCSTKQSWTQVRVLSASEVLEYEYEYFNPFYKSTRVRVQSTQNVLMNTLMSTFRS